MRVGSYDVLNGNGAGMGIYGSKMYNTSTKKEYKPIENRHIAIIQALTDTTVVAVKAHWEAPTDIANITIPEGNCLFVKAESVTISSGSGVLYYGFGDAKAGES